MAVSFFVSQGSWICRQFFNSSSYWIYNRPRNQNAHRSILKSLSVPAVDIKDIRFWPLNPRVLTLCSKEKNKEEVVRSSSELGGCWKKQRDVHCYLLPQWVKKVLAEKLYPVTTWVTGCFLSKKEMLSLSITCDSAVKWLPKGTSQTHLLPFTFHYHNNMFVLFCFQLTNPVTPPQQAIPWDSESEVLSAVRQDHSLGSTWTQFPVLPLSV